MPYQAKSFTTHWTSWALKIWMLPLEGECWRELSIKRQIREIIGINQIIEISGINYKLSSHDSSTETCIAQK
jgi:hypothetical protein